MDRHKNLLTSNVNMKYRKFKRFYFKRKFEIILISYLFAYLQNILFFFCVLLKIFSFFLNNGVYPGETYSFKYFFFDVLFNTHQDLNFAQYPVVIQTLGNELEVDLTIYSNDQNYQINFTKSYQFWYYYLSCLGIRKRKIQFVSYC